MKSSRDRPRLNTHAGGWSQFLWYLAEQAIIVFGTRWEGCFQEADLTCTSSSMFKSSKIPPTKRRTLSCSQIFDISMLSYLSVTPWLVTTCLSESCSLLMLKMDHDTVSIYLIRVLDFSWSVHYTHKYHIYPLIPNVYKSIPHQEYWILKVKSRVHFVGL